MAGTRLQETRLPTSPEANQRARQARFLQGHQEATKCRHIDSALFAGTSCRKSRSEILFSGLENRPALRKRMSQTTRGSSPREISFIFNIVIQVASWRWTTQCPRRIHRGPERSPPVPSRAPCRQRQERSRLVLRGSYFENGLAICVDQP